MVIYFNWVYDLFFFFGYFLILNLVGYEIVFLKMLKVIILLLLFIFKDFEVFLDFDEDV